MNATNEAISDARLHLRTGTLLSDAAVRRICLALSMLVRFLGPSRGHSEAEVEREACAALIEARTDFAYGARTKLAAAIRARGA